MTTSTGSPTGSKRPAASSRDLIHGADPDISEIIKRTVQPYFVLQGNACALLAAKDHLNLFPYDGGIVPDPVGPGHENKTARMISFYCGDRPGDGASSSATAAAKPSTADRSLGDAAACAQQCPREAIARNRLANSIRAA